MVKRTKSNRQIKSKSKSKSYRNPKSKVEEFIDSYMKYCAVLTGPIILSTSLTPIRIVLYFITPLIISCLVYFCREKLYELVSNISKRLCVILLRITVTIFFITFYTCSFIITLRDWWPKYEQIPSWLPYLGIPMLLYAAWYHHDRYNKISSLRKYLHFTSLSTLGGFVISLVIIELFGINSFGMALAISMFVALYVSVTFVVFIWEAALTTIETGFRPEAIYDLKRLMSEARCIGKKHARKLNKK